jgi:hypothetical protein
MRFHNWKDIFIGTIIVSLFVTVVAGVVYVCMNTGTYRELGSIYVVDKEYVRAYTETRTETKSYTENGKTKTRLVTRKIYHPAEYNVTFRDVKYQYRCVVNDSRFYDKVRTDCKYDGCVVYRTWKKEIAGLWGFEFIERN